MTEHIVSIVKKDNYKLLRENKTNYLLPIWDIEAMCILCNYIAKNGTVPDVNVYEWWKKEEFQEYLSYLK